MALALFWCCVGSLVYAAVGYPALMLLLARLRHRPPAKRVPAVWPPVSVVVAARNEASRIGARIENLFAGRYPPSAGAANRLETVAAEPAVPTRPAMLEVIVVVDGADDGTAVAAQAAAGAAGAAGGRLAVIELPRPAGKAAALNRGLERCSGEIVVFADARQSFAPTAIAELVANFSDPRVGAVSGALMIGGAADATGATGEGIAAYWRLEKLLRHAESAVDSAVGCTGAIYAIRRALFRPLPPDTLLDDVVVPMVVAAGGARVVFEPAAVAYDPQPLEPRAERRRKERTLAGNFQILFRYPQWLLPSGHRLWWNLLSHKYLRLAQPLFLGGALGASVALAERPFFFCCLIAQGCAYLAAMLGLLPPFARWRGFSLFSAFLFLNWTVVRGFVRFVTTRGTTGWEGAGAAGGGEDRR